MMEQLLQFELMFIINQISGSIQAIEVEQNGSWELVKGTVNNMALIWN